MIDHEDMVAQAVPAAEQPYSVEFSEAPGLFVKSMHVAKRGTAIPQHAHAYPHLTMVAVGAVRVWKDGIYAREYRAPGAIYIDAGVKHTFVTLVDGCVLYCIHRVDEDVQGIEGVEIVAENNLFGRS